MRSTAASNSACSPGVSCPCLARVGSTLHSANARRSPISDADISRVTYATCTPALAAAKANMMSVADLPSPGRPALVIRFPACHPPVRASRSGRPVVTPVRPLLDVS